VWNVETRQAKTQLIAHDKEVYDVAFATSSTDVFASVGADGSVRMFDLRSKLFSIMLLFFKRKFNIPCFLFSN
jgi:WD40 repeat protein